MGLTEARVTIHGPKGQDIITLLVDTGSLHSWIDENSLANLGVDGKYTTSFRTIAGSKVERKVGHADIEMIGIKLPCVVVFAQKGDVNVLGATTLENLGLEVDPTTKVIKRSEALAAY